MQAREILGLVAAVALVLRALLDWRGGTSGALLLVAGVLVAALVLRRRWPRA